jgi:glutamate-1-semialdehyde 2,1-aminomutase
MLKRFNQLCLDHGLLKGDNKIYVSLAHDDRDIADALSAVGAALDQLKRERQ